MRDTEAEQVVLINGDWKPKRLPDINYALQYKNTASISAYVTNIRAWNFINTLIK